MMRIGVEWLLATVGIYGLIGLVFGLWFVVRGVGRVDLVARDGSRGFRILILPGVAAFWPLFVWRLVRGIESPPDERNAHRDRAMEAAS